MKPPPSLPTKKTPPVLPAWVDQMEQQAGRMSVPCIAEANDRATVGIAILKKLPPPCPSVRCIEIEQTSLDNGESGWDVVEGASSVESVGVRNPALTSQPGELGHGPLTDHAGCDVAQERKRSGPSLRRSK